MNLSTFFLVTLGLIAGAVMGVLAYAAWLHRRSGVSLRLPDKWPLTPRAVVTNQEHQALIWLRAIFDDHLVTVKLPVLRFLAPADKEKNGAGERWQEVLNGVYCTFTVCTTDGNVVGCVDVLGKRGISKVSRDLKESLLSDCRIAYTIVRPGALPKASAMRAAFLGEMEVEDQVADQETRGGDSSFQADLDSFTRQKKNAAKEAALREINKGSDGKALPSGQLSGFNPDGTGAAGADKSNRSKPQFEDSFTFTDESRPAKLH